MGTISDHRHWAIRSSRIRVTFFPGSGWLRRVVFKSLETVKKVRRVIGAVLAFLSSKGEGVFSSHRKQGFKEKMSGRIKKK